MRFAGRMERFGEGIFSELLEIKKQKKLWGEPVIDLSVGTPDIPPARHIVEALCEAAADPGNYVYAINDKEELLKAVALWYGKRYGVTLNPSTEVCSLLGSQEGLSHIALSIVDPGDTVLVPDPCYPIFGAGPKLAGAKLHYMPQRKERGYLIDLEAIPIEVADRARLMVISYPNNPTTALAPDWFYERVIAFARRHDIIVIHDNAYSELVFDGRTCGSFLSLPGAKEVGVEFNSLSKTYGLAGAGIGFCVGNEEVVGQLKRLKSNLDYGMFYPIQHAAIAAITGDQSCVEAIRATYEARRDALCSGFREIGWRLEKPSSTMFVWAKLPEGHWDSSAFALELVEKAGVLVTPGSAFGPSGEGFVRLALVQNEDTLLRAADWVDESGILRCCI